MVGDRFILVCGLACGFTLGCGTDHVIDGMCAVQAEVLCHDFFRCCEGEDRARLQESFGRAVMRSEHTCRAYLTNRCEVENAWRRELIDLGRLEVDTGALHSCLELMIAPDHVCEGTGGRPWIGCPEWRTGRVPAGQPCSDYTSYVCVDGTVCDGVCVLLSGPDEPCTRDVGCVDGYFCDPQTSCLPRAAEGESCEIGSHRQCLPGLHCDATSVVCVPLKQRGDECTDHYECVTTWCDGVCVWYDDAYNYCWMVWYDRPLDEYDP